MRMALVCMSLLAFVAGGSARASAGVSSPEGTVITVSTTSDAVNGNVSSPAALRAHPGRDGISLREAIEASDNAGGTHTITFARSLAGKTITPLGFLPTFTRPNVSLVGLTTADGQPSVTLDASRNVQGCCSGLLAVFASGVTISHLRIIGVHNDEIAIAVRAGDPGGALSLQNISIEQNVFDNGDAMGVAMSIGLDFPGYLKRTHSSGRTHPMYPGATGASLTGVTVEGNVVQGFLDDGINVQMAGTRCSMSGLTIKNNTFADINYGNAGNDGSPAVELGTSFSGSSVTGTLIEHNTFTHSFAGVALNGGVSGANAAGPIPASGGVITGTVITQNVFTGNNQAIAFGAGAGSSATGNTVSDTEISDDVLANNAPYGAIGMGFGGQAATGNRIVGVRLVNDTIAFNEGGLSIGQDPANPISGVAVENTIFWSNGSDIGGPGASAVTPSVVSSLRGVDPRFVSTQDFHLQGGSPAINAGTSDGAPPTDLEDRSRVGAPDIGAYEFTG